MDTILILHGWGSCARNWSRVKELLKSRGYRVFVPDLPGFGETPSLERPWSIDDYVNWVRQYIENLSQTCGEPVEPFFLLGHSFGGGVAIKFSRYFPGKIRGVILVSPSFRRRKTLKKIIFLFLAKLGKIIFTVTGLILLWPLEKKIKKVLYRLAGTRDYYNLDIDGMVTMKESFKKITSEDLTYCLAKIKAPTLIVWGEKDAMTPVKEAYIAKKEINNAKLEIIKNGEHGLNLQNPEILVEKILNFIKNV